MEIRSRRNGQIERVKGTGSEAVYDVPLQVSRDRSGTEKLYNSPFVLQQYTFKLTTASWWLGVQAQIQELTLDDLLKFLSFFTGIYLSPL